MLSTSVASAVLSLAVCATSVLAAPFAPVLESSTLAPRQYIDYGPPLPINCSVTPADCPSNGPSGVLNYPKGGDVLTASWDNSGGFDFSYTPVNQDVGVGHVRTTMVVVTLRAFYYGVPAFADSVTILAALPVSPDFSPIVTRIALPGRVYDGDSSEQDDVQYNGGEFALQIVEQQVWQNDTSNGKPGNLIEFYSAAPLVNLTLIIRP
ncbi:hypothetical protein RQP46_004060 [Phenoliferia psychrophenolica]